MRAVLPVLRMFCAVLLILGLSIEAQAQSSLQDWGRVTSLGPGSEIWVKAKTGEKRKGALAHANDQELVFYAYQRGFRGDRYRVVLQKDDVKEVRLLAREWSGLIGAVIGGGAGAALGAGIDTAAASDHEFRSTMALLLGLLGAAVGAAIGKSTGFIKGEKLYVAP